MSFEEETVESYQTFNYLGTMIHQHGTCLRKAQKKISRRATLWIHMKQYSYQRKQRRNL